MIPHTTLATEHWKKKMTNGFNIITEIAGRITNPTPLYHIIFGKNGFFFQ